MLQTGNAIFFESREDFLSNCQKDPCGVRYTFGFRGCPIALPSKFPAAFRYEPDFDPHFIGSYVETNFNQAVFAAKKGAESSIEQAKDVITYLSVLEDRKKQSS